MDGMAKLLSVFCHIFNIWLLLGLSPPSMKFVTIAVAYPYPISSVPVTNVAPLSPSKVFFDSSASWMNS